jgi:hypothetical protein
VACQSTQQNHCLSRQSFHRELAREARRIDDLDLALGGAVDQKQTRASLRCFPVCTYMTIYDIPTTYRFFSGYLPSINELSWRPDSMDEMGCVGHMLGLGTIPNPQVSVPYRFSLLLHSKRSCTARMSGSRGRQTRGAAT